MPRELSAWQKHALLEVGRTPLGREATFGGATALSVAYLHHRRSEDLDFFLTREPAIADLAPLARAVRRLGFKVEIRPLGVRTALVLLKERKEVGHIDVAYYPYDPVDRPTSWQGLRVDSLVDMTVNKVQAVLTRARPRDFVDLWFLLREGPERKLERLLSLARAKFDVGASRITLAEQLLKVEEIAELPRMLRPVALNELQAFFVGLAREIVRRGP
ncbi:MAG TPA: nucleotidyl transferase AbiEii/AbiGii toxin family protein [Polyangiaceae bacterium]|nr:nucleotidyl transferase AbiEii/AbiGii toxin family protein [Polyangiaceae bacterium]